jgi:hypothetical protein
VADQENYWILGEMYSDGTYLFTDAYTDYGLLPYTVAGQSLSAQLFIYDVNGTVDGITQEITWQIDARVKFKAGSALSTCQTSIFTIDVYGDYGATETFVSDPFTVPALTSGCGGATNIAAINTALSLGSSGASLTLPKFGLSPVPTGS